VIAELADVAGIPVSRETLDKLQAYAVLLSEEAERQNLIARSTLDSIWGRHILDSAQLVRFAPAGRPAWLDIGSGAGLPGMVIACLTGGPVTLVEPRRLRADFLHRVCVSLQLNAVVHCSKVERLTGTFDVITARAVAPLGRLLHLSHHLSTAKTIWALPKGRSAADELAEASRAWQGAFHVERSVTDPQSFVIVATEVRAKA
jgi:16S rRNA (guanine527-N7)-methyltransferase